MSSDFNNIKYPYIEDDPKDPESHKEGGQSPIISNAIGEKHPFFSPEGMLSLINSQRNMANSIKEKPLTGEIKEDVIKGIVNAARKTKLPIDIITFAMDWEKDMTSRSDGSDAEGIAKKITNAIPSLRNSLGRDPMIGEIFAGFILGDASKVKKIFDDAENKPDEEVSTVGSSKDDVVMYKNRNGKEKKRTNRELYDWFFKRVSDGRNTFKTYVPDESYKDS